MKGKANYVKLGQLLEKQGEEVNAIVQAGESYVMVRGLDFDDRGHPVWSDTRATRRERGTYVRERSMCNAASRERETTSYWNQ